VGRPKFGHVLIDHDEALLRKVHTKVRFECMQEKMKGRTVVAKETERPAMGNVMNLMEALKRSIEGSTPRKTKSRAAAKSAFRRKL
jgi:non-homologous end joining protein Ku